MFIKSHIFVLPTIEEGQAIVIGEALSHGLPIISTPLSGTIDYIKNNELLEKSYKIYLYRLFNLLILGSFTIQLLSYQI